jgi:hypothetical protein
MQLAIEELFKIHKRIVGHPTWTAIIEKEAGPIEGDQCAYDTPLIHFVEIAFVRRGVNYQVL